MTDSEALQLRKTALRAAARARRAEVLAADRDRLSRQIAAFGIDGVGARAGAPVALFMSLPDEIDTEPLGRWLHSEGWPLCMPVIEVKRQPLVFRAWAPGDEMDEGVWGIREPRVEKALVRPHVVVTPLLAFDRHGGRLGYGGGYYDRTLRALRLSGRLIAVGLGLDELEVAAVPQLDYDEPLDWVLTQSGPRRLRV